MYSSKKSVGFKEDTENFVREMRKRREAEKKRWARNRACGKKNTNKTRMPSHIQFDSVSPATKLLEKRRMMYEVDETFINQKAEYKR